MASKRTAFGTPNVPNSGVICDNNDKSHVGDIDGLVKIINYIKNNIKFYISTLKDERYNEEFIFRDAYDDDEGLLKYIKDILSYDVNKDNDKLHKLLTSLLEAIQVDQAHDFLDGSTRSFSSNLQNSQSEDLSTCLKSPRVINNKIEEYLEIFKKSKDVHEITSGNHIEDIKYSIIDTGVRDNGSKEIVSRTQQVVALASIIDSAGCSSKDRNMPIGIDYIELIITNIGYIFYQSFYRWFRENNIVTLIGIFNDNIENLINSCKKNYSITFYHTNFDETNPKIFTIYKQEGVIPGCNGDFTVNKIVNILYMTPNKCCNYLFENLFNFFSSSSSSSSIYSPIVKTKQIIMTYYVLNKGFGDFSQMFSCLYFNNRKKYEDINQVNFDNIHHKNIILCTVDRFLAYISHLCKCPFILGASYTCRYYSCDTNSKYYNLNVINAYNKFNNFRLTTDVNHASSLLLQYEKYDIVSKGRDNKSILINSKLSLIYKYYNTHFILIKPNDATDATDATSCSSYKMVENSSGSSTSVLSYSLKLDGISNAIPIEEINEKNFNKLKEIYNKLVSNDCNKIAESEIFRDFILNNYDEKKMYTKFKENVKLLNSFYRKEPFRKQQTQFETYEKEGNTTSHKLSLSTILGNHVNVIGGKLKIFQYFISYFEDVKNNTMILENHLKKLYIIINNNKLDLISYEYINDIIKELKKCLNLFINEIKNFDMILFNTNLSITILIFTNNPYYSENSFKDLLSIEVNDITSQYNAFILQYDILKNIKNRFEELKFDNAFHNARIAYHIAFGKLRLAGINSNHVDKSPNVNDIAKVAINVNKFILKLRENVKSKKIDVDGEKTEVDGE